MNFTPIEMETIELANMRLYQTPSGNYLPSITTCLGKTMSAEKSQSLENWRDSMGHSEADAYTEKACDKGTATHLLCERFLRGEDLKLNEFLEYDIKVFNALKLHLKKINPIHQEVALYSDILQIAGRVDCIGHFKDVLSVIDFKTSNKVKKNADVYDYKLQITFYALAYKEMYNQPIKQGVILMSVGTGFPLIWVFDIADYIEPLKLRINKFYDQLAELSELFTTSGK